jgi:hypothetical protein
LLSPAQAREEIEVSKRELEMMGLPVRHFTYPFNQFCAWTRELVARHYVSARTGNSRLAPPVPMSPTGSPW